MVEIIYNKLANKFDLDPEIIERVTRSQFDFTANTIEQGEFQSIRLHYFGVFGVKPLRLKQLNDRTTSL